MHSTNNEIPIGIINKDKILKDLKADMRAADTVKKEWDTKRDEWISETYGKPYGNEVKGKSRIVTKDIRKHLENLIPSLVDPFLSNSTPIKCEPVTFEDAKSARQNEILLNTQFTRKFKRNVFMNKAARVLGTEGTVVVRTSWNYEDEEVEENVLTVVVNPITGKEEVIETTVTVTKILKNQPDAEVCRNEDIYLDPTCMDDIDKCQFIIHRYESDMSSLKSEGIYHNLDQIKTEDGDDGDFDPQDSTRYKFEDKPRKKLLVYEYWGNYDVDGDGIVEPIVCTWIGNTIIRLESNPYPDNKPPFIVSSIINRPFHIQGDSFAEIIGDNQKVKTGITRGILDNMRNSNNGQVGIRKGALDQTNKHKFLQGKNFEFNNNPSDFWQGSYNNIPNSAFNVIELMNAEMDGLTGTKSGTAANTVSLGGANARQPMDTAAMRRTHLVRNIADTLVKPIIRKWISYNAEFLEDEEVVRVTNEEYVPIKKDDLEGRIDITIDISTQEDNVAKAQELGFLMQTLGNTLPFEATKILMSRLVRLHRMPDLEKQLMELQPPQPDPMDQQLKQLSLIKLQKEIEEIDANIKDKLARAGENEVDRELKLAKAKVEEAKARKLGSDADMADLKFLKDDNEYDRTVRTEEREAEYAHIEKMAYLQRYLGGKDDEISVTRK